MKAASVEKELDSSPAPVLSNTSDPTNGRLSAAEGEPGSARRLGTSNQLFRKLRKAARKIGFSILLSRPMVRLIDRIQPLAQLGDRGERVAERYLLKKGWVIVARGYEDAVGELDLVAVDDQTLVFVEVKTRTSHRKGHPAEAVDLAKQKQISRVGLNFLKWHRLKNIRTRFDIVAITWPEETQDPVVQHYVSAFEPTNDW